MEPLPSGNDPAGLEDARALGWCWGGFLLPYFWLMGHGRLTWGMLLTLTALVPPLCFLHLAAYPAAAIYLGRHGYEIAWRYQPFRSVEDMVARQAEWVLWGWVFKAFLLATTVLLAVYLVWVLSTPEFQELFRTAMGG